MSFVESININGIWREGILTEEEEKEILRDTELEHNCMMAKCIKEAESLLEIPDSQEKLEESAIATIAAELFSKRAMHVQFLREQKAHEKLSGEMKK